MIHREKYVYEGKFGIGVTLIYRSGKTEIPRKVRAETPKLISVKCVGVMLIPSLIQKYVNDGWRPFGSECTCLVLIFR